MDLKRDDLISAAGQLKSLVTLTEEETKNKSFGIIAVDHEDLKWLKYTVELLTKLIVIGEVSWNGSGDNAD